jgi:hypothetical protein
MKRFILLLVWAFAAAMLPALETSRTWTDTQGRTLTGVFMEANVQEVTVKRDDGTVVRIARALLSKADLDYADQAQAAKPIAVGIEASRAQIGGTKTSETKEITTVSQQMGFSITLTNQSKQAGQNLRVEYQIYYRKGQPGVSILKQPLDHQGGSQAIDKIDTLEKTNFRTTAVTITNQTPKTTTDGNITTTYHWPSGGQETVYDKLDGIWVRVYQNDELIGEYLSSEDYRKDAWPGATPPATGAKKKAAAAPAT